MKSFANYFGATVTLTLLGSIAPVRAADADQEPAELRTENTAVRFAVERMGPMVVGFGTPGLNNWATGSPETSLPTAVEIGGKEQELHWSFVRISKNDRSLTFTYESADSKLSAVSVWSAVSGPGPVEHAVTLLNDGDSTITCRFPATIAIALKPQADHELKHWWVKKGAGYVPETGGPYSDAINPGYAKVQHCGPYSDDSEDRDAIPWFAIHDSDRNGGVYGGVEFSGWTEIGIKRAEAGDIELTMGMQLRDNAGRTRLKPGDAYCYPTCFIGAYQGDVDDACNGLHRWVESHLRPTLPWGVTPVLVNNSWGAGMAVDDALARKMIDDCAALGIELYHIDAGWYKNVGDWRANPAKFPNGLAKVADYAHSKGLKFGLWVGWTQGGSSNADDPNVLCVFNPSQRDWFGRDVPADWKNQDYTGEPVCLGAAGARAWCLPELERIVKEFKLDLLEHDQIMMLDYCGRDDHGHIAGDPVDTSRATAEGYYGIYDKLRQENPHLLFEDCVNGGKLVDFGVIKRVHYFSATDTYDPATNRRVFYDTSYPMPPSMIELYLENDPGKTHESFTSMLRSGMLGWATIMIDTTKWSPEQHERAKREFAIYKEKLRPLIAAANLYHILPRPLQKRWDGVQYHNPATDTGAVFAFRAHADEDTQIIKLRGLKSSKRYAIECVDGSTRAETRSGKELMEDGLAIRIADEDGSDLVFLSATP